MRRGLLLALALGLQACGTFLAFAPEDEPPVASQTTADAADEGGADDAASAACNGDAGCTRYVFVTSATYDGDLGGLNGADAKCMLHAKGKPTISGRTFRAWLSTSDAGAASRIPEATAPFVRVDGIEVADDKRDLLDGMLSNPILLDETGVPRSGAVWTDTRVDGTGIGTNCLDWTVSSSGGGKSGDPTRTDQAWTEQADTQCASAARLYCFEY